MWRNAHWWATEIGHSGRNTKQYHANPKHQPRMDTHQPPTRRRANRAHRENMCGLSGSNHSTKSGKRIKGCARYRFLSRDGQDIFYEPRPSISRTCEPQKLNRHMSTSSILLNSSEESSEPSWPLTSTCCCHSRKTYPQ